MLVGWYSNRAPSAKTVFQIKQKGHCGIAFKLHALNLQNLKLYKLYNPHICTIDGIMVYVFRPENTYVFDQFVMKNGTKSDYVPTTKGSVQLSIGYCSNPRFYIVLET